MTTVGSVFSTRGKRCILNRSFKTTPDYSIPTYFRVGINSICPNIADTDLDNPIPIADGSIRWAGDRKLTGEKGGTTTTDNTTTYKEGAGTSDATAQNFLTNTSFGTKSWVLSSGSLYSQISGTQVAGLWMYIKDATTYAKLLTTGTAVYWNMGSGTADYYTKNYTYSQLKTGWNWLTTGTQINVLHSVGSPYSGTMNTFSFQIITNNATDTFSTGDVIVDLLRQWTESDTVKTWLSGTYPYINESALTVEMRGELTTGEANGFDLDSSGDFNADTDHKKIGGKDVYASESKSSTDKFTFIFQNRLN